MYGAGVFLETDRPMTFLTLTSHEKLNPHQSLYVWPKAWKKLHARAKYADGKQAYMMIPERHTDGRLHMHALTTWTLGTTWWKKKARACGLGYIASEEFTRTATGAGNYVTKYLTKSLDSIDWPTKFRRIRRSRDWPKLPDLEQPDGWAFQKTDDSLPLDVQLRRQTFAGQTVLNLDHVAAWEAIKIIDAGGEVHS